METSERFSFLNVESHQPGVYHNVWSFLIGKSVLISDYCWSEPTASPCNASSAFSFTWKSFLFLSRSSFCFSLNLQFVPVSPHQRGGCHGNLSLIKHVSVTGCQRVCRAITALETLTENSNISELQSSGSSWMSQLKRKNDGRRLEQHLSTQRLTSSPRRRNIWAAAERKAFPLTAWMKMFSLV